MSKIYKIGDQPTDPKLLLKMVDANIENISSIVISVISEDKQNTYWTAMPNNDMAFHATAIYDDLITWVKGEPNE